MKPLAIIGLDPGTTSAYAILNLQGQILHTFAAKEMPLSKMIAQIFERCQPVLVATDKAKVPSFVDAFARKLGVVIISPDEDLKKEEKRAILSKFQLPYNGGHEHDCLAVGYFAYQQCQTRLLKIKQFVSEHHLTVQEDEFTKIAINEPDLAFHVIQQLLTKPLVEQEIMNEVLHDNRITKQNFLTLHRQLSQAKAEKKFLEQKIQLLQEMAINIKKSNFGLQKKATITNQRLELMFKFKEERLKTMTATLERQRLAMASLQAGKKVLLDFITKTPQYQLVKKLPSLSYQTYLTHQEILKIGTNDIVLVEDTTIYSEKTLKELSKKQVVILSRAKLNPVIRDSFVGAEFHETVIRENEHFALVEPRIIEKLLEKKDLIDKVVREYQARKK